MILTPKAIAEVERLSRDKPILRLSVVGGGCSGLSYKLSFESTIDVNDKVFPNGNVDLIVDARSYLFTKDLTIDFTDGLQGVGFTFTNPNAKRSCGCGSSFST
jgi:iron-sulfur cluster assembly protein